VTDQLQLERNKAVARLFFARLTDGDVAGAVSLFADDGEFWQAGSDGPGRVMALAEVKTMFLTVIGGLPEGIVFAVGRLIAEGDWVAAEVSCRARLGNGNEYRNSYCFHFEIINGTITSGREYMDTMHATRAFSGS
jgi:uncharacterized protein